MMTADTKHAVAPFQMYANFYDAKSEHGQKGFLQKEAELRHPHERRHKQELGRLNGTALLVVIWKSPDE